MIFFIHFFKYITKVNDNLNAMASCSLTITKNWEFHHFLTYILLKVGYSDEELTQEEIQEIKSSVCNLLYIRSADDIIQEVEPIFRLQSSEDQVQFIKDHKSIFLTDQEKIDTVLQSIEEVIIADLSVDDDEMAVYRTIKKLVTE